MFQLAKRHGVNLLFQAGRGLAGPESPWPSDHTGNVTARKDAHDRAAVLAAHALSWVGGSMDQTQTSSSGSRRRKAWEQIPSRGERRM